MAENAVPGTPDAEGHRTGRLVMPEEVLAEVERAEPDAEPDPGLETRHDPSDYADVGTADRPGEDGDEISGATHAAAGPNMLRTSMWMAVGTVFSRVTGFARTIMLAAALGTHLLGDAYQTANNVAFIVNDLLIGGLLASVFVPFLVKRRMHDTDGGKATEDRLFTTGLLALLLITVVAIAGSEILIRIYAGGFEPQQHEVAVQLARFLMAQIFFIGGSGIASAMLNARKHLVAPMWAPVLNNLTIIAVAALFLVVAGPGTTPETIQAEHIALLGLGTTVGQVIQCGILFWALRAAGFSWRPRLDLRGSGMGEAMRAAGWMFVYIAIAQFGMLISTNVSTRAGVMAAQAGDGSGAGITAYKYAFMLFQLPYAIIAVTVITALLPRLSEHVAAGRRDQVRSDFSRGFRLSSALLVPISLAMVVFAIPFCVLIYAHGSTSVEDARAIGTILMVFSVMLLPFTLFQLQMRVFYAVGDTRTPALIAIPAEAVHAVSALSLLFLLPPRQIVMGLPVAYGLYYIVGSLCAWLLLRRELHGMDGRRMVGTLVRLHVAAVPSVVAGVAVLVFAGQLPGVVLPAIVAIVVGGVIGAVLYILTARWLNVTEVTTIVGMVSSRLLRRR